MKVLTIVGARPQFIKAAAVSRALKDTAINEILVHTGQHFDENMSSVFFEELEIPEPGYNLGVAGGHHGAMTGAMLAKLEEVFIAERPDRVLVYGDTNSTLAGSLAAAKLHIPVAHVEAGLRSFNMRMPEEINRILTDRVSDLLFCPTETAVANLNDEGYADSLVHNTGDVMYDIALYYKDKADKKSTIIEDLKLQSGEFVLSTCHRAENTDDPARLTGILEGLARTAASIPVVLPVHPRTRKIIEAANQGHLLKAITTVEPLSYIDMVALEKNAKLIMTDSGGVQKEAFFYQVPCVTMRTETEWVETVSSGWNHLVDANADAIHAQALESMESPPASQPAPYGNGDASEKIVQLMTAAG